MRNYDDTCTRVGNTLFWYSDLDKAASTHKPLDGYYVAKCIYGVVSYCEGERDISTDEGYFALAKTLKEAQSIVKELGIRHWRDPHDYLIIPFRVWRGIPTFNF